METSCLVFVTLNETAQKRAINLVTGVFVKCCSVKRLMNSLEWTRIHRGVLQPRIRYLHEGGQSIGQT